MAAIYWVTTYCSHVPWTLHADDDILLDPFLFQRVLHRAPRDALICTVMEGEPGREGKWAMPYEQYPYSLYPPFCQGVMWLAATNLLPKLLQASQHVDFLWIDDVYLTGVVAQQAEIPHYDFSYLIADTVFIKKHLGNKLAWYHLFFKDRVQAWSQLLDHYNIRHDQHNITTLGHSINS